MREKTAREVFACESSPFAPPTGFLPGAMPRCLIHARTMETETVIVVFTTGIPGAPMPLMAGPRALIKNDSTLKLEFVFPAGGEVKQSLTWDGKKPRVELTMPPQSVAVFSVK